MSTETKRQPEALEESPRKSDTKAIVWSIIAVMIASWLFSEWAADRNPVYSLMDAAAFILR